MAKFENPFDDPNYLQDALARLTPAPKPKPESMGEAAVRTGTDLAASFGSGSGQLVRGVGNFLTGRDNPLVDVGQSAIDYWDAKKSAKLQAQEAELARRMGDENTGLLETAGYVLKNPYLALNMTASSAPSMAAGMGAGGLIGRAMAGLGVMTEAGGGLTSMGARVAGGIGEGLPMMPDVYENTQGNAGASLAGLALGVATNIVTPGNVSAQVARRVTGASEHAIESAVNKTVARRFGTAVGEEAAQEFGQEGGQALLEQVGRGENLDFGAAGKNAAVGAVLGGFMGGALHPVVGEGAPLPSALADKQAALAKDPNSPILQREVAHEAAKVQLLADPTPENEMVATTTAAQLAAARNPESRALNDAASMAVAATALSQTDSDGVRVAADTAHTASTQAIQSSNDINAALSAFADGDQASSDLRVATKGIEATVKGVQEASHTFDEATAEIETPEQRLKNEIAQLRLQHQQIKNQTAQTKLDQLTEEEKGKLAVGSSPESDVVRARVYAEYEPRIAEQQAIINNTRATPAERGEAYGRMTALIKERAPFAPDQLTYPAKEEITAAPAPAEKGLTYHVFPGENGKFHVVDSDFNTHDTYTGTGAEQDATAAAEHLNMSGNAQAVAPKEELTRPAEKALPEGIEAARNAALIGESPDRGTHLLGTSPAYHILARPNIVVPESVFRSATNLYRLNPTTGNLLNAELDAVNVQDFLSNNPSLNITTEERRLISRNMDQVLRALDMLGGATPAPRAGAQANASYESTRQAYINFLREPNEFYPNGRTIAEATALVDNFEGNQHRIQSISAQPQEYHPAAAAHAQTMLERNGAPRVAPQPATPSRTASELLRELEREYEAEQARENKPEGEATVPAPPVYRQVNTDFTARLRNGLADGSVVKLAQFFKAVMAGRGQRTLNVNTASLRNTATMATVTQRQLNTLKDRFNEALNRQAREWAEENNQPVPVHLTDPVVSIMGGGTTGSGISIRLHGLGRNGANPYMVVDPHLTGSMTMDRNDHHLTTVGLERAPGSSDLGYRLAAELGAMFGARVPSSTTLLTNNRFRRHVQSVYADSLFGPDVVSSVGPQGQTTPQGVPGQMWANASPDERMGMNLMRMAHQVTENRHGDEYGGNVGSMNREGTLGFFMENLRYNNRNQIEAMTDPKSPIGWPKGTIVTTRMLQDALLANQGGVRAVGRDARAGIGVDTAKLGIMINTALNYVEGKPNGTIPAGLVNRARQIGREMGGWVFSKTGDISTGAPLSHEDAAARVNALLGEGVGKVLLDGGMVNFVQSESELTGDTFSGEDGKIQGATSPDGKITLVLDNLHEGNFDAVLQHEGLHGTLKALLGDEVHAQLMSRLETMVQAGEGSSWLTEAEAAIPEGTDPANRTEELAAYAVEQYVKGADATGNPLIRWAKDLMSSLRASIIKSKLVPEAVRMWAMKNVQPADLAKLAIAGLKAQAFGVQNGTKLSTGLRSSTEYETEIGKLMQEHAAEETTGPRRSEINTKVAHLRTAWRAANEAEYVAAHGGMRFSIDQEVKAATEPVNPPHPQELNIVNRSARGAGRLLESFRSGLQDKHVTLRRIQQLAGITAEKIKMDTIGALDRLGSRLMSRQEELVMNPLAQIENRLHIAGFTGDEGRKALDDLLINHHVEEYNRHIAEINPAHYEIVDGKKVYIAGFDAEHPGSGISDKDARAAKMAHIQAVARGDKKAVALEEARNTYRQMISDLQDYAVTQGLEKQATIDAWNEKFPNYTPFNRELDLQENLSIGTVPGSQGFSLRTGISRRAMGSLNPNIVSPTASAVLFGLKTTTRGENAEVARTMLNFAREFIPNYKDAAGNWKPMWSVNRTPTQRVVKRVNVYTTKMADGSQSTEFYNREQARAYANAQQELWVAAHPDADPNTSGIEAKRLGDGPQSRVIVQAVPNPLNSPNAMVIPENGENVTINFDEHSEDAMAILDALKGKATSGTAAQTINKLLTPARMFSRWVVATSTGYNPFFAVFNAARDVQGAMISVMSDKIPGWSAADSAALIKNFMPAAIDIGRQNGKEFWALHSNTGPAPAPKAGSYAEWAQLNKEYGGLTGVAASIVDQYDAETQMRRLFGQDEITRSASANQANDWITKFQNGVLKVGDNFARFGEGETQAPVFGWISKNLVSRVARMNEATEIAARTLVFKTAAEKFMADGQPRETALKMAANISKNVSTNFNRRGTASSWVNQALPFFNAAMQGSARLAEVLFEKETFRVTKNGTVQVDQRTKLTNFGKGVIGSMGAIGAAQAVLLAMAGFADDDIPQQIKDRAFIIPLGGKNYAAIPMPHGFNALMGFARELTDAALNPKKATSHIANAVWEVSAFNPMGTAGNWMTDLSPAILDPFVQLSTNKDVFGRPIAKEDVNAAAPTPGFTRAKEGASTFGRKIAEGLNWISGGNEDQPGAVSPTPDQIDFAIGQITGGVGRELGKVGQAVAAGVDVATGTPREPLPTYKMPLIGRLYGDASEPAAQHSKLFTIRTELNTEYARYKGLLERGETEAAAEFKAEHPELVLRNRVESFVRKDANQRKKRALARTNDDVEKVNEIADRQEAKITSLLDQYNEMTK